MTKSRICFASKVRMGSTILMTILSCDSVMAGDFFSQPDLQVPEKEMGQHAREHVMVPSRKFAHLVVVHSQLCLAFFEALLNGPT